MNDYNNGMYGESTTISNGCCSSRGNVYKEGSPPPDLKPDQRDALNREIEANPKTKPTIVTRAVMAAVAAAGGAKARVITTATGKITNPDSFSAGLTLKDLSICLERRETSDQRTQSILQVLGLSYTHSYTIELNSVSELTLRR